ncbi:ribosomal protein S27, partial [Cryptosporidium parvum Iowa II]
IKLIMDINLLNPDPRVEAQKHKLKRLIQSPNSFFMDVRCPGCLQITTVFSHAQSVVFCGNCSAPLCQPTGGRCKLTDGCSFRRKND